MSTDKEESSSIVPDRCWEEKYRGDSRKWLMRDGTTPKSHLGVCSTMKETYRLPEHDDTELVGIRRSQFRDEVYQKVAEEIIRENNMPAPIEEYCTEYDGNFHYPGYDPEKIPEPNTELHLKYPLYSSEAASYWKFQVDSRPRGQTSLPGLTTAVDLKKPFKKNSEFTKPISEVYDSDNLQ